MKYDIYRRKAVNWLALVPGRNAPFMKALAPAICALIGESMKEIRNILSNYALQDIPLRALAQHLA